MKLYGRKLKVVVRLFGAKAKLTAKVSRSSKKGQARLTLNDADEGLNVPIPIIASCLKHSRPYYWNG